MSLEYASQHLTKAVKSLANSERPLHERLQIAWDTHVQMLWMTPCLTADLLREFRDIWHRYTAPSDDRTATKLQDLAASELKAAIDEIVDLSVRVAVAAHSDVQQPLVTLDDLA